LSSSFIVHRPSKAAVREAQISVRVLLADDHETVRAGLRVVLAQEPRFQICGEAENGRDAVAKVQQLQPDAVILDVSMPVMNGLEAAREIRRVAPSTKIVMFSMHDSTQMIETARQAGADAFVLKSAPSQDLVRTIRDLVPVANGNGTH
jgi:two-component system nitrate/nitrite response regulator NarL